jgi:NitT/TauT family transport system ATP-binding protein
MHSIQAIYALSIQSSLPKRCLQGKASRVGSIEIHNLHKAYGNSSTLVLEGINLAISESDFVCLLGPSGCGKSTVLNMVAGFDFPTGGEIFHDGQRVTRPSPRRAMIFQDVQGSLFSWLSVRQNVEFGPRMQGVDASERVDLVGKYIELVGLTDFAQYYPYQLSGGMKQRVQIARALANNPDVLLMDEPFGALDAQTRGALQGELERIWNETKKTVLFVTHDISESVRLADRIVVFSKGPRASVLDTIAVDMPRPRELGSAPFTRIYRQVESLLHSSITAVTR